MGGARWLSGTIAQPALHYPAGTGCFLGLSSTPQRSRSFLQPHTFNSATADYALQRGIRSHRAIKLPLTANEDQQQASRWGPVTHHAVPLRSLAATQVR